MYKAGLLTGLVLLVACLGCTGSSARSSARSHIRRDPDPILGDREAMEKLVSQGRSDKIIRHILSSPPADGEVIPGIAALGLIGIGVLPHGEAFRGAASLLQDDDPKVREYAEGLLRTLLKLDDRLREDDVAHYLRTHDGPSGEKVAEVVMAADPDLALPAIADTWLEHKDARQIRWKAHLVATETWRIMNRYTDAMPEHTAATTTALGELAKRREWWIRLYVAVIVGRYDLPGTGPIRRELSSDDDVRVRRILEELNREAE